MEFPIELNGILTKVNLNVLPLGSYDALIGMQWLLKHRDKVYCYKNVFECIDEEGRSRFVKWIPKQVLVRQIPALQLRKFYDKGCQLYAIHIQDSLEEKGP